MKKQFIKEAQRLQKLAGINEAKVVPVSLMQKSPYLFIDADGFLEIDIDIFKKYILSNLEIIKNLWNKDGGDWNLDNITQEELNKAIKTFQLDFPDNIQGRIDLTTNNPAQDYLSSWDKKEEIEILKIFLNTLNDVINQLNEAKIVPQKQPEEKIPEGWKEDNTDVGEIYRDGSTIIKYYIRQHPASWIVPEYHRVYIAKRPNGEYYVQTMPSYNEQEYQSKPFSTFIEAKNYAFEDMNAIIDTEYDDYDEYEGEGPAYDEDY